MKRMIGGSATVVLAGVWLMGAAMQASAAGKEVEVEFVNKSKWAISELYFSSTKNEEWGPDQLGKHVVNTGDSYLIHGIPSGKYDIKLVDEDGDECIVDNITMSASEKVVIDDEALLNCQAATDEEEE